MTDISDINWTAASDASIMESLGAFIRHNRLQQNKTQDQLAREAGIASQAAIKSPATGKAITQHITHDAMAKKCIMYYRSQFLV